MVRDEGVRRVIGGQQAAAGQLRFKLRGAVEEDGLKAEGLGGGDVGGRIIDQQAFPCRASDLLAAAGERCAGRA